jgi:hypothetical protein
MWHGAKALRVKDFVQIQRKGRHVIMLMMLNLDETFSSRSIDVHEKVIKNARIQTDVQCDFRSPNDIVKTAQPTATASTICFMAKQEEAKRDDAMAGTSPKMPFPLLLGAFGRKLARDPSPPPPPSLPTSAPFYQRIAEETNFQLPPSPLLLPIRRRAQFR